MKLFEQQPKMPEADVFRIITIGTGAPPLNLEKSFALYTYSV